MWDYPMMTAKVNPVEPVPRRIRAVLGTETVLDPTLALYCREWPYYPQYYRPSLGLRLPDPPMSADSGDDRFLQRKTDTFLDGRLSRAFVSPEPKYIQATGFVLDPEGRVLTRVYSSGAIGQLMPDDVIGMPKYLATHRRA
jgi:hypothetical protein